MYIDPNNENKHSFAQKWGLVSLAKKGHKVTLICGSRTKKRQEFKWNNIKVIQLPALIHLTNSSKILKNFSKELNKHKTDIIHTHHYGSFVPEITLFHAKKKNIPIVLSIHNSFTEGPVFSKILATIYLIGMQITLPFYNHITFISKYLKNKKRFLLTKKRSSILRNQIPHPKKIPLIKTKQKNTTILFIGRITHQKGIDLIIKALKKIKQHIPNIHLKIIGSGKKQYVKNLKKLAKKLNVHNNISFLGYLTGEKKEIEFQTSNLIIIPSRDEGFGNVVIETLLKKKPILISNTGALPETSGGFATSFKSENSKDLAKKAIKCLKFPPTEKRIIQAYKYAKTFTSEKIANDLEKLYSSLLN